MHVMENKEAASHVITLTFILPINQQCENKLLTMDVLQMCFHGLRKHRLVSFYRVQLS